MLQEIALDLIQPSPFNPRKKFEGQAFDQLAASIREKGVLQPILIRPLNNNHPPYQIVAGERRLRASMAAGKTHIPCITREIDDDTAFEMLMIENLQREDLTELEEAEAFKTYLDRHGMEAIESLAEKINCRPCYIRRRIIVLNLPKYILEAWDKGKLKFGHLELLSRVGKKDLKGWFQKIFRHNFSARRLKEEIDSEAPLLKKAPFDLEASGCHRCPSNSDVQKDLFNLESPKTRCLDRSCFKQRVNNWLSSKNGKRRLARYGTPGFRFYEDMKYETQGFYRSVPKACKACKSLVVLVDIYGNKETWTSPVCVGDEDCFKKARASTRQKSTPSKADQEEQVRRRQEQRSMFFREQFIKEEIPRRLKADDDLTRRLSLIALILSSYAARDLFAQKYDIENDYEDTPFMTKVLAMDIDQVMAEMQALAIETLPSISHRILLEAAKQSGIKLESDFLITEPYLKKMTKAELVAIGHELGLWNTQEPGASGDEFVHTFIYEVLGKKRNAKPEGLKKGELIRCFLESGLDLTAKVPSEIYIT